MDDGKFNKDWKSYVGAATSGAIGGAAAGFTFGGSLIATIAADAAIGAGTSAIGSAAEQAIVKGKVSRKEMVNAAISGGVGGGLGRAFSAGLSKIAASKVANKVKINVSDYAGAIGNRVRNVAADVTGAVKLPKVGNEVVDDIGKRVSKTANVINNNKTDFIVNPKGDVIPTTLDDNAYVVRGGESKLDDLITNQQKDNIYNNNRGHISANAANGVTLEKLGTSPEPFKNGSITHTTVGDIRNLGKGWDVIPDPTLNNPFHVSIVPPSNPINKTEAGMLSNVFNKINNIWKLK